MFGGLKHKNVVRIPLKNNDHKLWYISRNFHGHENWYPPLKKDRDLGGIPLGISPGSQQDFGRRDSRQPKSCRESLREANFPAAKILLGISAGSEIPGSHKLARNLPKDHGGKRNSRVAKILTRFMARISARFLVTENFYPRRDSWQEFWQDSWLER